MKTLILIATILLGFTLADARCNNSYVDDGEGNSGYADICDSPMDLLSTNLALLPALPSTDLKPLPSLQLPPLGTGDCDWFQVNGRWSWVCW